MNKTRVLLLFGGQSAEHEVSVISARSVCEAIDRDRYDLILAGITRDGRWLLDGPDQGLLAARAVTGEELPGVCLARSGRELVGESGESLPGTGFDVVFPLLHGPYGEDGTMQGLLELAGVAYVGAGVAASAVGMDKELARAVFANARLPQTAYTVIRRVDWRDDPMKVLAAVEDALDYPLFVKPVNLGSSIGISKVHDREQLRQGLTTASAYDVKMMVEASVDSAHEIECAVLGNEDPQASGVGEIVPGAEFYDYTTKYLDDRSRLVIPADLSAGVVETVREMSVRAFRAIDCSGLARVDFFVRASGEVLLNEINTMPGFTPISMYPKLWQASGLVYPDLIDRLIQLALERHTDRQDLVVTR